jgi:hypothetical protein
MDEKLSSLLRSRCYPDRGCETPALVREERENLNVRAPLLVAICLSTLSAADAEQARTFQASVDALTAPQRDKMKGQSWSEVCPVPLDDLVSIHLNYVGFDDAVHDGVLVVHRKVAKETVEIFGELFAVGFPIERMQPYEDFPIGEYAAHNDTVGFYCRPAQDNPKVFSSHAYGISVDINSMTNPYHDPRGWWPVGSNGDRNRSAPGLLTEGSEAVKIFMRHGWIWGGLLDPPDYMHFGKITVGDEDNPLQRPVWASQLQPAPK